MKIDYEDLFHKLIIKYENLKIEDKLIKEELKKYKKQNNKINKLNKDFRGEIMEEYVSLRVDNEEAIKFNREKFIELCYFEFEENNIEIINIIFEILEKEQEIYREIEHQYKDSDIVLIEKRFKVNDIKEFVDNNGDDENKIKDLDDYLEDFNIYEDVNAYKVNESKILVDYGY